MRGFSREQSVGCFRPYGHDIGSRSCAPKLHFPRGQPTPLNLHPSGGQPSFLRPPGFDAMRWYRNINLFSIAYASRPRLRSRLTPGGLTSPGKPRACGERVSHPFYRYSYRHQLSQNLHHSFRYGFDGAAMLPYHRTNSEEFMQSEASVRCLSPVSFSAQPRLTSELLRFLQRMAASKPTS